jgi:hypothetical protein
MASSESPLKLVKEVIPPQHPQSGLGVMMVAATAMFFAVASSAFILRARMSECCTAADIHATPLVIDLATEPVAATNDDCGGAVYEYNPDGSVASVYFEVCPSAETMVIGDIDDVMAAVEVRRIVYEED